jgi:hypothetical protein
MNKFYRRGINNKYIHLKLVLEIKEIILAKIFKIKK